MAKRLAKLKEWLPGKDRRPFFNFASHNKGWRSKSATIRVTRSRELVLTFRRFKTAKQNRANTYRQVVLPASFMLGKIREIAIRYKRRPVPKSAKFTLSRAASTGLVAVGLAGVVYFGAQITFTADTPPPITISLPTPVSEDEPTLQEQEQPGLSRSEPAALRIGAIGVDTEVLVVGRQADGTMETPPIHSHKAGWYEMGPTPGETGPAIIVGHVGTNKGPSVFWRLGALKPGDEIEVMRKDNKTVTFRVTEVQQFDQDNFPTQTVYSNTEGPALRLITCGGVFDRDAGRYTHNTVVFADIVEL